MAAALRENVRSIHLAILVIALVPVLAWIGCDDPIQPDPVCTFSIAPVTAAFGSDGGTSAVSVTTSAPSCSWAAAASVSWVSILGAASGVGSGTVNYRVSANTSVQARTGTMTVGGEAHVINQQGRPPTVCLYEL